MAPTPSLGSGHRLGVLGVLVAIVGLGLAAGLSGLLGGLAIALAWYLLPAAYAFAVGQLLAVALLSRDVPLAIAIVVEGGLLTVLAGLLTKTPERARTLTAFAVAILALGAVTWGMLLSGRPLWMASVTVAVVVATLAYGLHRLERVRLGLVEPTNGPHDHRADTEEVP